MPHHRRLTLAICVSALSLTLAGCAGHGASGTTDPLHARTAGAITSAASGHTTTTAGTTTTTVAPLSAPVTLLAIGDSLGEDLAYGLGDVLAGDSKVTVIQAGKGDSGLVEPQFYDWPQDLASMLEQYHPQVVVVFLGANDVQNFYDGSTLETFGTPAWATAYGQRVAQMMQEATEAGARVLWVGMPIMDVPSNPQFSSDMQVLNGIYAAEAASHPGVSYFSSWSLFTTPSGQYSATKVVDGRTIVLRDPDGIHIPIGAGLGDDYLADAVVARLRALWGLP